MSGAFVDPYQGATMGDNLAAVGHAADDAMRNLANGATLHHADQIAAWLAGKTGIGGAPTVEGQNAQSQAAMAHAGPVMGPVEQIAGMMAPASLGPGGVLGSMATGAALGAGDAHGQGQDPLMGAITGAGAGLGGGIIGKGLSSAADAAIGHFNPIAAPTTQGLKAAAQGAYDASEGQGITIGPAALQRLKAGVSDILGSNYYRPDLHPGGAPIVKDMAAWPSPSVAPPNPSWTPYTFDKPATLPAPPDVGATLEDLLGFRKLAGQMASNTTGSAANEAGRMGGLIQDHVDNFVDGLQPGDLGGGGNLQQALADLQTGRANWAQYKKADAIEKALDKAGLRASSTGSGGNINNATRQDVLKALYSRASWTPDEYDALRSLVEGTNTQNTLRQIGKLSPQGNGLIAQLELMRLGGSALGGLTGAAAGGTPGMAAGGALGAFGPPLAGVVAKTLADRGTQSAADNLLKIIQNGGKSSAPVFAPLNGTPVSKAITSAGVNASLGNAKPDSRAAALAAVLSKHAPAPDGLGGVFGQQ